MIHVFDRFTAEGYSAGKIPKTWQNAREGHFPLDSDPTIAIRCMSSPECLKAIGLKDYEPLRGSYVGVLDCVFDDIRLAKDAGNYILFNRDHAKKIKDFVEENKGKFKSLMVHCDAGASRSPAVAAALGDYYGWEYDYEIMERHHLGVNGLVYKLLTEVLHS